MPTTMMVMVAELEITVLTEYVRRKALCCMLIVVIHHQHDMKDGVSSFTSFQATVMN
jgi:hypothetical protein